MQNNHYDSEIIVLLEQLGGASCDDLYYSDDDNDSGRVSPYTEMDVAEKFKESHDYRPRSIHHSANGYRGQYDDDINGVTLEKSPSPSCQRHSPSPVGQLPSLPEG